MVQATTEHSVELDGYFTDVGEPAESMELPPNAKTYIASDISHAISLGIAHGVRLLSPEETAAALPHYPGFGTNLSPENLSA